MVRQGRKIRKPGPRVSNLKRFQSGKKNQHISSFDIGRTVAAFGVIVIHCNPFAAIESFQVFRLFLMNFFASVIPYFFLVSGYFFTRTTDRKGALEAWLKLTKRLLLLLIIWSIIYKILPWRALLLAAGGHHELLGETLFSNAKSLLTEKGTFLGILSEGSGHLWFLSALISGTALWALITWSKMSRRPLIWASALLLLGLGRVLVYTDGSLPTSYYWGNGPIWAASLIAFATWAYHHHWNPSIAMGAGLILGGFTIRVFEVRAFTEAFHVRSGADWAIADQFTLGSTIMAIGWFGLSLARPSLGANPLWQKLAQLTLGIYLIHYFWIMNLPVRYLLPDYPLIRETILPFLIFLLSSASVLAISHFKKLRWLVT